MLIDLENVNKSFDKQKVLNNINLTLDAGQIIGLIGPSGAGKTTLIKTALGMEKADSGVTEVMGTPMPNRKILGKIGYMAQSDALYDNLTAKENLEFFGQLKGLKKQEIASEITRVAGITALTAHLNKRVSLFSGGMKRRLSLALALLGQPKLLVLDEPTVGIDPALRKTIWEELKKVRDKGCGILVTTHVMDEAEQVDQVVMLMGTIIAQDSPAKLKEKYQVKSIEEVFLQAESEVLNNENSGN